MTDKAAIQTTLDTLYGDVFNEGKVELMDDLFSGPYIQHNPLFPDGTAPLSGFLKEHGSLPNEVQRTAIDGDLAFVHVKYPHWFGKEHAAVDIFRFDDEGKIVEHWDVFQAVPETSKNDNTMY